MTPRRLWVLQNLSLPIIRGNHHQQHAARFNTQLEAFESSGIVNMARIQKDRCGTGKELKAWWLKGSWT
jgi:hypothetical protein